MESVSIATQSNQTEFHPGSFLRGTISWNFGSVRTGLDLRLLWTSLADGSRDSGLIETLSINTPTASGSSHFELILPVQPYSFNGTFSRLRWSLEAATIWQGVVARFEFSMSPTGKPLELAAAPSMRGFA